MAHSFEQNPYDNEQTLRELEFTPEPPTLDEQQFALMDVQRDFMTQWMNDPEGFMPRLITWLDSDIDLNSPFTHIYPGVRFKENAMGIRTEERIILRIRRDYLLPDDPKIQSDIENIPVVTTTQDGKRHNQKFTDSDVKLIEHQIEELRELRRFCPNLNEDLMTITSRELVRIQCSDASIAARRLRK